MQIAFVILLLLPSLALAFPGRVVHITDGDTVTVLTPDNTQVKVRLYGIDTPEKRQPFGARATEFAREMAALHDVDVRETDRDRYGRTVGIVTLPDGRTLNAELIRAGLAWVYVRYCRESFCPAWADLERQAREARAGLWADPSPVPPWEWRRRK